LYIRETFFLARVIGIRLNRYRLLLRCQAVSSILVIVLLAPLTGCATFNPLTIGVGLASYKVTGKGLVDHALGVFTQKDCNILGAILSDNRAICENRRIFAKNRNSARVNNQVNVFPALRLSDSLQQITHPTSEGTRAIKEVVKLKLNLSDSIGSIDGPKETELSLLSFTSSD
tara:strand:- start:436 stop:954 length:519 start_codon:yes stop_codon:yes gene_type:complete